MNVISRRFDPETVEWHHIKEPAESESYQVNYEYSILAYDTDAGRLDMMMRFKPGSGYCERHNHVASTSTLILKGEQHLREIQPDGSEKDIVRKAGDYALAGNDALPHLECGGPDGCILILSLHAPDGVLFGVYDEGFNRVAESTIEQFVQRWDNRG